MEDEAGFNCKRHLVEHARRQDCWADDGGRAPAACTRLSRRVTASTHPRQLPSCGTDDLARVWHANARHTARPLPDPVAARGPLSPACVCLRARCFRRRRQQTRARGGPPRSAGGALGFRSGETPHSQSAALRRSLFEALRGIAVYGRPRVRIISGNERSAPLGLAKASCCTPRVVRLARAPRGCRDGCMVDKVARDASARQHAFISVPGGQWQQRIRVTSSRV